MDKRDLNADFDLWKKVAENRNIYLKDVSEEGKVIASMIYIDSEEVARFKYPLMARFLVEACHGWGQAVQRAIRAEMSLQEERRTAIKAKQ